MCDITFVNRGTWNVRRMTIAVLTAIVIMLHNCDIMIIFLTFKERALELYCIEIMSV